MAAGRGAVTAADGVVKDVRQPGQRRPVPAGMTRFDRSIVLQLGQVTVCDIGAYLAKVTNGRLPCLDHLAARRPRQWARVKRRGVRGGTRRPG
jgi:hypothetical protein